MIFLFFLVSSVQFSICYLRPLVGRNTIDMYVIGPLHSVFCYLFKLKKTQAWPNTVPMHTYGPRNIEEIAIYYENGNEIIFYVMGTLFTHVKAWKIYLYGVLRWASRSAHTRHTHSMGI